MNLHQTMVDTITARIKDGTYRPGDRIPTYRQLAEEFGASHTTIRAAILTLKASNLLESRVPEGVFVMTKAKGRMRARELMEQGRPLSQEEIGRIRRLLAAQHRQGR